jgi:hypothetical protein
MEFSNYTGMMGTQGAHILNALTAYVIKIHVFTHHAMEAYGRSESNAPFILRLRTPDA